MTIESQAHGRVAFESTWCPLCGLEAQSKELYVSTLGDSDVTARTFSARRTPDRVHYRMVRCTGCGLVRSDPVLTASHLSELYRSSHFTYEEQIPDLRATYGKALERLVIAHGLPNRLLEVGCGNGFFLQEAAARGVAHVYGVELSQDAVSKADPSVAKCIVTGPLTESSFPQEFFDIVCLFQVLDHLPAPVDTLKLCKSFLRPGGVVLSLNHNLAAISAAVLRERSPIVDVEHTFLFTPKTAALILESAGFTSVRVHPVINRHSVDYLLGLWPPGFVSSALQAAARVSRVGGLRVWLPLGNIVATGIRPD